MELKKSKRADLEANRFVLFQLGLVIALSIVFIAFESATEPRGEALGNISAYEYIDQEQVIPTIREEIKQKQIKPILIDIKIVANDEPVLGDIINFDPEAFPDTEYDFENWIDDQEVIIDNPAFLPVEDQPLFNGGKPEIEFRKYIAKNLVYPDIAVENGVDGTVYVQFVINKNGKVVDVVVIGSADPSLDKESIRVVTSSPLWTPGKQREKPVKVAYTFPIKFVLH